MYVASKLGHLLCFPIGAPFHISSGWLSVGIFSVSTVGHFFRFPDESSAYSSCLGTRISGMRLTCPAQLSCDLKICASMLVVSACSRMLVSGTAEAGTETNDCVCFLTSFNRIGKRQPYKHTTPLYSCYFNEDYTPYFTHNITLLY